MKFVSTTDATIAAAATAKVRNITLAMVNSQSVMDKIESMFIDIIKGASKVFQLRSVGWLFSV